MPIDDLIPWNSKDFCKLGIELALFSKNRSPHNNHVSDINKQCKRQDLQSHMIGDAENTRGFVESFERGLSQLVNEDQKNKPEKVRGNTGDDNP